MSERVDLVEVVGEELANRYSSRSQPWDEWTTDQKSPYLFEANVLLALLSEHGVVRVSENNPCPHCEGSGTFWADGKAHLPHYTGPTVPCSTCGGSGTFCVVEPLVPEKER